MIRAVAAPILAIALAACATDNGPYPSLAPRPIEKGSFDEPTRPHATATPDAALDALVATQDAGLTRIAKGFDAADAAAGKAIDRPAARTVGSDAWLDAQASLARLDDWRAQASAVAAAVETAASARAARLDPPYPPLDALAARAAAETAREAEAAATRQARLLAS